jgi:glutaredoxin-like YruB-family protein
MTEIEVYTTPTCPYCTKLKNWLEEENIDFEEFDLSQNRKKAQEIVKKTGQRGVPQTLIKEDGEEKAVVGYQPDKIKAEI